MRSPIDPRLLPCAILSVLGILTQGWVTDAALGQIDRFSHFRIVRGVRGLRGVAYVKPARDLNGDGYADYLVHYTGSRCCGAAVVALCSGVDGRPLWMYRAPKPHVSGTAGQSDVGDFDGHGKQDLVLGWYAVPNASGSGSGLVVVQAADGSRTFWTREADDGVWSFGMRVNVPGDVTGDGIDDILVVAQWAEGTPPNAGRLYVLSGRDGSDVYVYTGTIGGEGLGEMIHDGVGDVDGDGHADFAYRSARKGSISIHSGGDGSLIWEITDPDETVGWWMAAPGDLDGDGLDDVVYPIEDRVVAASVTDKRLLWEYYLTGLAAMQLDTLTDVDHDGIDEVLVTHRGVRFEDRPYGAVIAVSGRTGQELWRLRDIPRRRRERALPLPRLAIRRTERRLRTDSVLRSDPREGSCPRLVRDRKERDDLRLAPRREEGSGMGFPHAPPDR